MSKPRIRLHVMRSSEGLLWFAELPLYWTPQYITRNYDSVSELLGVLRELVQP